MGILSLFCIGTKKASPLCAGAKLNFAVPPCFGARSALECPVSGAARRVYPRTREVGDLLCRAYALQPGAYSLGRGVGRRSPSMYRSIIIGEEGKCNHFFALLHKSNCLGYALCKQKSPLFRGEREERKAAPPVAEAAAFRSNEAQSPASEAGWATMPNCEVGALSQKRLPSRTLHVTSSRVPRYQ